MFEMFAPAAPSFDDPIGLLKACHMRILTNCKTLEKLTLHLAEKGADEEAATAAERVHKYFTTAAPLHHQDEEVDLFPRLRHHDKSLADAIAALESEHQTMAAAWEAIEPDLQDLSGIDDIKAFAERVATFCKLYRGHIVSEETNCLSPAEELLTADDLKALGEAMEARRA
ncbi:MAG TPA: hemerythrin domain-containing protein [Gammaproteobacteria bacterium]|nr:hemerythrin domain-containing protein [Gammaproteobacteria bacterium]